MRSCRSFAGKGHRLIAPSASLPYIASGYQVPSMSMFESGPGPTRAGSIFGVPSAAKPVITPRSWKRRVVKASRGRTTDQVAQV